MKGDSKNPSIIEDVAHKLRSSVWASVRCVAGAELRYQVSVGLAFKTTFVQEVFDIARSCLINKLFSERGMSYDDVYRAGAFAIRGIVPPDNW